MQRYYEVGIADSVAAFRSSPTRVPKEIFGFRIQIMCTVQILMRYLVRIGIRPSTTVVSPPVLPTVINEVRCLLFVQSWSVALTTPKSQEASQLLFAVRNSCYCYYLFTAFRRKKTVDIRLILTSWWCTESATFEVVTVSERRRSVVAEIRQPATGQRLQRIVSSANITSFIYRR